MAIITVLSGSYCHHNEIVSALSQKLGYRLLDDNLYTLASEKSHVSREKLVHSMSGAGLARQRESKDRLKALAYLEAALAELIKDDNAVLSGCAGFLIPGNIAHVLKVGIVADLKYRTAQAVKSDGLAEADALAKIQDYDREITACARELVSKPVYDESLYDIVIPMDKTSPEAAVRLICDHAQSDAIKTTAWSQAQVADFLLSSTVKVVLTEAGHRVDVFSDNGHVVVAINEHSLRMGHLQEKLKRMASEVPGVTEVTTKLGPKYSSSTINPWESIDAPPKVLLVDDEKEFVQTLSERLKNRNLESSIAYDGEQALEMLERDVPDVIVLDLLMPGIDGIETLRRVKQSHPEVEVIILTGHGSDREQSAAEDLGAFAYLRKPVNVNELAQVMKQAYARRRRNQ